MVFLEKLVNGLISSVKVYEEAGWEEGCNGRESNAVSFRVGKPNTVM